MQVHNPKETTAKKGVDFAHAIQQPALEIWQGKETNVPAAQQALYHRARCDSAARRGEYNVAMERT
jgi:fructose-bisphosphate aldolase class I